MLGWLHVLDSPLGGEFRLGVAPIIEPEIDLAFRCVQNLRESRMRCGSHFVGCPTFHCPAHRGPTHVDSGPSQLASYGLGSLIRLHVVSKLAVGPLAAKNEGDRQANTHDMDRRNYETFITYPVFKFSS